MGSVSILLATSCKKYEIRVGRFVGRCAPFSERGESVIVVAITAIVLALTVARWYFSRRQLHRTTAVAMGGVNLSTELLRVGAISPDQYARGLNDYDFKVIRRNELWLARLSREHPGIVEALEDRVFRYL